MSRNQGWLWMLLVAVTILALLAAGVFMPQPNSQGEPATAGPHSVAVDGRGDAPGQQDRNTATEQKAAASGEEQNHRASAPLASDLPVAGVPAEKVAEALSQLNRDEAGKIVVDDVARDTLDAAFLRTPEPMSSQRFSELQSQVLAALPGEAGQQAANVAERYYHYSNVYRDLEDNFRYLGSVDEIERGNRQLQKIRRTYLGEELASALFAEEERMMQQTLENMRILSDDSLSQEEKERRQEQLNPEQGDAS